MRLGIATCLEKPEITASDQLAADKAAALMGCEIVAVPWDSLHPPAVDALVVRSTWGYYLDLPRFESWLESLRVPVFNPVGLMLGNLNKKYLLDLAAKGVPIVPTLLFHDPLTLREELRKRQWDEVVLKPAVSASSHLTFRLKAGEFGEAAKRILAHSDGIAQPFMNEIVENGEVSAVYHKAKGRPPRFSHALRKRVASGDFRVQAEFGGRVQAHTPGNDENLFCADLLSKISGEWLYARVDYLNSKVGPLLCELELVEPYLFYDQPNADLTGFAEALASHLA